MSEFRNKRNLRVQQEARTRLLILFVIALVVTALTRVSEAKVWEATETWDERWEEEYSQFIHNQFNEDVFVRGPYAGLATDCADAVYAARIIFASEKGLPFVIQDPSSSRNTISQNMSRFDSITSKVSRVKAFIEYIGEMTDTQTLPDDTYPIAINREAMRPGVIWLRNSIASENFIVRMFSGPTPPSGHTEVIKEISPAGVIYLMGSTVPAKVRNLLVSTSFVYFPANERLGFRRWIWPQNRGKDRSEMNFFSREQFKMGALAQMNNQGEMGPQAGASGGQKSVQGFTTEVQQRLSIRSETKEELLMRMGQDLCAMAHLRNEVVQDALRYRAKNKGCLSGEAYDNFSTPSRDKRMKDSMKQMLSAGGGGLLGSSENKIEKLKPYFSQCKPLTLSSGEVLTISNAMIQLTKGAYLSNPNESELARWGLASAGGTGCGK